MIFYFSSEIFLSKSKNLTNISIFFIFPLGKSLAQDVLFIFSLGKSLAQDVLFIFPLGKSPAQDVLFIFPLGKLPAQDVLLVTQDIFCYFSSLRVHFSSNIDIIKSKIYSK